ncbi:MAG: hypothetical protein IMZ53_13090 [Thermoplasmata archaeon]|nr:hypothetical protein [Thermoplasmata archaeon]
MIPKPEKPIDWKKKANDSLSKLIRARGICELHQKIAEKRLISPCVCSGVLQACHKLTRANLSTFLDERNVFCGCSGSNAWSHFNQLQWDSLWRLLWSEDMEYLDAMKHRKVKISNWTYKVMSEEFEKKLADLKT